MERKNQLEEGVGERYSSWDGVPLSTQLRKERVWAQRREKKEEKSGKKKNRSGGGETTRSFS